MALVLCRVQNSNLLRDCATRAQRTRARADLSRHTITYDKLTLNSHSLTDASVRAPLAKSMRTRRTVQVCFFIIILTH